MGRRSEPIVGFHRSGILFYMETGDDEGILELLLVQEPCTQLGEARLGEGAGRLASGDPLERCYAPVS